MQRKAMDEIRQEEAAIYRAEVEKAVLAEMEYLGAEGEWKKKEEQRHAEEVERNKEQLRIEEERKEQLRIEQARRNKEQLCIEEDWKNGSTSKRRKDWENYEH